MSLAPAFNVGPIQASALEIYVFDPIFDEPLGEDDQQPFPGTFDGRRVVVEEKPWDAYRVLVDGANSADHDGDAQLRDALQALGRRILRRACAEAVLNNGGVCEHIAPHPAARKR